MGTGGAGTVGAGVEFAGGVVSATIEEMLGEVSSSKEMSGSVASGSSKDMTRVTGETRKDVKLLVCSGCNLIWQLTTKKILLF